MTDEGYIVSVLENSDDAFCPAHEEDMERIGPVVKHDGVVYTTGEEFQMYYCPHCVKNHAADHGTSVKNSLRFKMLEFVLAWKAGKLDSGEMFRPLSKDPSGGGA